MEKKEIVEVKKDGKAGVSPDDGKTLGLSRTYKFEGEEISSLRFTRLEDITAEDMIRANNIMVNEGISMVVPENTLYFALIMAADATGLPIEFFKQLKPGDAVKVRRFITNYFF
ncbi:MAG: phage tail assembly protein [Lachnospiraceae bacterium]|nr:phage tail assembly protein [Lachnospiraceae bacterium]